MFNCSFLFYCCSYCCCCLVASNILVVVVAVFKFVLNDTPWNIHSFDCITVREKSQLSQFDSALLMIRLVKLINNFTVN